ncbi:hypothetical protein ABTM42_20440, partial [Acinetobacter baumannii]
VKTANGTRVMFRARRGDVAKAQVVVGTKRFLAEKVTRDDLTETFVATVPPKAKAYSIELEDGGSPAVFGPYTVSAQAQPVAVPDWTR